MIVYRPKKKKKKSRYSLLLVIMVVIFSIFTLRLAYIQLYKHDDYKEEANLTSARFVSQKAPRGEILDRQGNILATNIQTYALSYTVTDDSKKEFYKTMDSIINILSENGEKIEDDFKLKYDEYNNWYIDYDNTSEDLVKNEDIRFKRDRGLNEVIEKKYKYNELDRDMTDEEIEKVNEELLKITPQEVFYYLIKSYGLSDILTEGLSDKDKSKVEEYNGEKITHLLLDKGYTYETLRNYIIVKDEIKMQSFQGYKTVNIKSNINKNTAYIIMQKLNELPGIDVTLEPTRSYPYKTLASSVIGYLSSINEENEEKYEMKGYDSSTDLIGVSGIESAYESQLRGVTGGTTVKVNSSGRVTEELFKLEAYPGNTVNLTIDKNIQWVAEQELQNVMNELQTSGGYPNANRGAVVVAEAKTGKILALVSLPNYDPNIFSISGQLTNEQNKEYFSPNLEKFGQEYLDKNNLNKNIDELFPIDSNGNREDIYDIYPRSFYNYATQGLIAPGSTFKPMTSIAGLESGAINSSTKITDTGVFNIHPDVFGEQFAPECSIYTNYHGAHGTIDVTKALEVSCNFYFYETGYRMYTQASSKVEGLDTLAKYAWKFGLGVDPEGQQRASTGIEITENFGQVYNFTSYKNIMINMAKFNLRDGLEGGNLRGASFIPFDYSDNQDDEEILKKYKKELKDKIIGRLSAIDPDGKTPVTSSDEFSKLIRDDVINIMNSSGVYKANVKNYEDSGKKYNQDNEAIKVSNAIAQYIIHDIGSQITSPAQEIYACIGQGMNNFTPLQLVQYISTLVNGGTRYKLHLVDSVTNTDGKIIESYEPEILDQINLSKENVDLVKLGMSKVNAEDSGTAAGTFIGFPIQTGGKTGTADFRSDQKDIGRAPYATYVSFAPLDDPEIVVAEVVYDGGHGGNIASIAKLVYEVYFQDKIKQIDPNYQFDELISQIPGDNRKNS